MEGKSHSSLNSQTKEKVPSKSDEIGLKRKADAISSLSDSPKRIKKEISQEKILPESKGVDKRLWESQKLIFSVKNHIQKIQQSSNNDESSYLLMLEEKLFRLEEIQSNFKAELDLTKQFIRNRAREIELSNREVNSVYSVISQINGEIMRYYGGNSEISLPLEE